MSKPDNEFILNLAAKLQGLEKTAAKKQKDEDGDEKEKDKDDEDEEKEDKKKKPKKPKKKESNINNILNGLIKIAEELDEMGAEDGSSAVDDALKVIVNNLKNEQ